MAWFIQIIHAIVAFGPTLETGTGVDVEAPADPLAWGRGHNAAVSKRRSEVYRRLWLGPPSESPLQVPPSLAA